METISNTAPYIEQNPETATLLKRFVQSLGIPLHDAEDLVQEALIQLQKQLDSPDSNIENPRAYLFRIVRNMVTALRKKKARRNEVELDEYHQIPDENAGLENKYDSPELKKAFEVAYMDLSEAERELLRLRYFEHKSLKELAKDMGCTPQNVWKILDNIKKKILRGRVKARLMELDPDFATEIFEQGNDQ